MDFRIALTTEYAVKVFSKYYFVASEMNVICAFDIIENKIEVIGSIPDEELRSERLSTKLLVWKEELIIIPMNGKRVWFFHITEKRWRKLCIKFEHIKRKTRQAFIFNDSLFMIGCHYPAIICANLKTEEIKYLDAPFKIVREYYEAPDASGFGYFRHDCVIRENFLYFASFITNKVLILNLNNFQWKYVTVGNAENGYSGIAWDGKTFWLAPRNERYIVRWDGKNTYKEFMIRTQEMQWQPMYAGVIYWNGDIIFPAIGAKYTVVLKSGNILNPRIEEIKYLFYRVSDSGEAIYTDDKGEMTILFKNGEVYSAQLSISLEELLQKLEITKQEYARLFLDKFDNIVYEDEHLHLNILLLALESKVQKEDELTDSCKKDGICGKTIWEKLL